MVNEAEVHNPTDAPEAGRALVIECPECPDPLRSLRLIKWLTRLFVYPAVTALIPLDHGVSGLTWHQAISVHLGGYIIATIAIELAFAHSFTLRKRSAFPGILLTELGREQRVDAAAQHALSVIVRLLDVRAAFLALRSGVGDDFDLISVSGMGRETAERLLQVGMRDIRKAMCSHQPIPLQLAGGAPSEIGVSHKERLIFVPVVALRQPIGLFAVLGGRRGNELGDCETLSAIGNALGLSLENLRQGEEIRESEERLHTVIASTPIVMFALDREGTFVLAEGKGLNTLGFDPSKVLGLSVYEQCRRLPQVLEVVRRAFAGESSTTTLEVNGRVLEAWLSPVRDHNDELSGITGVVTDITERKRAEEAVAAKTEEYIATTNLTGDIIARLDKRGRWTFLNDAACQFYGKPREELLGTDSRVFGHPDDLALTAHRIRKTRARKELHKGFVNRQLTPMGTRVVEWNGYPIFDEGGQYAGIQITGRDITDRMQMEEALRLRQFSLDRTADAVFWVSPNARLVEVNDAACRALGYSREELLSMTVCDIDPDFPGEDWPNHWQEIKQRGSFTLESRLRTKDGRIFPVEVTVNYLEFNGKECNCTFARDITERKRAEEALRRREEHFRSLIENASDVIVILNDDETIRYVSPSVKRAAGYDPEDLIYSAAFRELLHPDDQASASDAFAAAAQDPGVTVPVAARVRHRDGSWRAFEGILRNLLHDPAVAGFVLNCRDVTERKRAEETIRHLAYHDALTDLPNRTLFQDRLTVAVAQARREKRMLAVLFLDLDHFKVVNDTVGHLEGDKLLRYVAERLIGLVREGDTVARVGGDEFALLSSEIARVEDAAQVAQRVLEGLRRPWVLQGQEFLVTTSIGIAVYPADGEDAEVLLRNADTAMYRAKEHGRDAYQLYTPAMNARIVERLSLQSSLRRALERDEFMVYYQPQVNLRTGQVVGVEALVRWQHLERGLVFPAEFIPVAEETGLIVPLGEWVLRTACAQCKIWQEAGLPLMRVAVNLSARQFQQRSLTDTVAQVLQETGLPPHLLQLEITEGIAMQDVDFTITMLRNLREMGVQIAIDDFGTGYSSLAYLKRFPIDAVKIDRSFVSELTVDPNDAAIATTVITMAHSLKLSVIAEGVETEDQLAFLKQRQCDEMQGYLFSKPVPAEDIEKILRRYRRRAGTGAAVDSA